MKREEKWMKNYNLAKKYYEEHGNLLIPQNYIMKDEIGNDVNIGLWINRQRNAYKENGASKINKKQIELLNKIGMVWNILNNENIITDKWMKNYNLAKEYYKEHGNLLVPRNYIMKDEIGNDVNIGMWINTQRTAYKENGTFKINKKQIQMLDEIHMIYNVYYYKKLLKEIELEYYLYQYGLLDLKNVNELINNKILEYKDNEIVKGNALVLQKNKIA